MRCLRESAFLKAVVLPFALVLWLSGCYKWVDLAPPTVQQSRRPRPGSFA